jgi:hypothetical protein
MHTLNFSKHQDTHLWTQAHTSPDDPAHAQSARRLSKAAALTRCRNQLWSRCPLHLCTPPGESKCVYVRVCVCLCMCVCACMCMRVCLCTGRQVGAISHCPERTTLVFAKTAPNWNHSSLVSQIGKRPVTSKWQARVSMNMLLMSRLTVNLSRAVTTWWAVS